MSARLVLLCMFGTVLHPTLAHVQTPVAQAGLNDALAGRWTGVLEYRDYKEPETSLKRVTLPTWLTVSSAGSAETWHYVYDDGPGKVVDETEALAFDAEHGRATLTPAGKAAQVFQVTGYDTLTSGRGTLVLSGTGTDNGKPSERRMTLTVGRNMLLLLEEVRPAGTQGSFAYRHQYRFVRRDPPAVTQQP